MIELIITVITVTYRYRTHAGRYKRMQLVPETDRYKAKNRLSPASAISNSPDGDSLRNIPKAMLLLLLSPHPHAL